MLSPPTTLDSIVIVGASARAAAESARRAGYRPCCVDLFADRDLRSWAQVERCPWEEYPVGLLSRVERAGVPADAPVLLVGAMENHPEVVEALSFRRPLLGSGAAAIEQVRAPTVLSRLPAPDGVAVPRVRRRRPLAGLVAPWLLGKYVRKPLKGAGGRRVRIWPVGRRFARDCYLQQYVRGRPISAVYVCDGWSSRLVGATEQLIGDEAFGADGFRYCGNIGPLALEDRQVRALMQLGVALAQKFDLRGPIGIDAVVDRRGVIWPVEINPRYTAGTEVLERSLGWSVLSKVSASTAAPGVIVGKAVVFARGRTRVPDLYEHFGSQEIADVPEPGAHFEPGWPVCTLIVTATDPETCRTSLRAMATKLYEVILR